MSEKRTLYLAGPEQRQRAFEAIAAAPKGYRVTVEPPKRSLEQNDKFHAICGDIAKSGAEWMGKRRTTKQWKVLLVSGHTVATGGEAEIVPGIEGEFVNIRESTASMSKRRGASLIEYTLAFCALRGIELAEAAAFMPTSDKQDKPAKPLQSQKQGVTA